MSRVLGARTAAGTRLRLRELARKPTTLAMLVALPPVVIEVYGVALESFPSMPGMAADPGTVGRVTGTLFAVAFLAGLVGLFQVISARRGDERLVLSGYSGVVLLASRLATMAVVVVTGALVAFAVFAWRVEVAAPLLAFGSLLLAGAIYGLVGVVVGTLVGRDLEGSLVLVFLADVDNVLASGLLAIDRDVAQFAPLYHPHELFVGAATQGSLPEGHLLPAAAVVAALLVVAMGAYSEVLGNGGVGA